MSYYGNEAVILVQWNLNHKAGLNPVAQVRREVPGPMKSAVYLMLFKIY